MARRIEIDGTPYGMVADNNAAWDIVQIMTQWDTDTWAWWARHMADYKQIDDGTLALSVEKAKRSIDDD